MTDVRVRYAPSPTGHFHIGAARTVLFNWLYARKHNGKFIIRFEDTDLQRNVEGGEESQLQGIKWLGLDWDESVDVGGPVAPYRSMERLHLYKPYVDRLIVEGHAYHCYCTEQELEAEREALVAQGEMPRYMGKCRHLTKEQKADYEQQGRKPSIRFNVPADRQIVIDDHIRGRVEFDSNGIGDFVMVRPDGIPTYNFAVTLDDHMMKITHVIRGEEHLSNTPRQVMIYQALGWETPGFAHVSLILNPNRQKMSKRDESIIQFIEQYEELGYLPEAIVNFLALLGWTPEGEREIYSSDELIQLFSLDRVSKSPAVFDTDKLKWMNNEYIKQADLDRIVAITTPHLVKAGYVNEARSPQEEEWVRQLVALYQEQLAYGAQIIELAEIFFKEEADFDEESRQVLAEDQVPTVMQSFLNVLPPESEFTADGIKAALKQVQKETGFKGKQLFMPVRVAVSGQTHGRDLLQTIVLLGREKVTKRLQSVIDNWASIHSQ
jgi:nondiscriminating glutamyl-tRNA synthetase